jgi:hypothetical protein
MMSVIYFYDALSRLETETRQFNGLSGSFPITYGYNLAGQLKSIADPFNSVISYQYDVGVLSGVTGSGFAGVTTYASGMKFRAWGGLREYTFGKNIQHKVSMTYDSRLRPGSYRLTDLYTNPLVYGEDYQYYGDSRIKSLSRVDDHMKDRAYTYDLEGRITQALSGAEARGEQGASRDVIPFQGNYQYDVWDNMKSRTGWHWSRGIPAFNTTYVNNRSPLFTYNADGVITQEGTTQYTYDAMMRLVTMSEPPRRTGRPAETINQVFDGDGQMAKRRENNTDTYRLNSTLLKGALLTTINAQGGKVTGSVYANGQLIATQNQAQSTVTWVSRAPSATGEWGSTGYPINDATGRSLELDPLGRDIGVDNPYVSGGDGLGSYPLYGDAATFSGGCTMEGGPISCDVVGKAISRNYTTFLYNMITQRFGWLQRQVGHTTVYDDKAKVIGFTDTSTATSDGFDMTVRGTPGWFEEVTNGYNMLWLSLQPEIYVTPQKPESLPVDVDNVRRGLAWYLVDPKCASFISDLLDRVSTGSNPLVANGDLLAIFDTVRGQSGIVRDISVGGGEARGSIGGRDNDAQMVLSPTRFGGNPTASEKARIQLGLDIHTTLHETIHFAGLNVYTDRDLALAVQAMTGEEAPGPTGRGPLADAFANSAFWDKELRKHCRDTF